MPTLFTAFHAGDRCVFERTFTAQDFEAFARLSGDRNALHHDAAHAASTRFGRTVVPLHVTSSPLSMVAGMVFPGEPSLYLGHEVRASLPVFYGERLVYSARIVSINAPQRTLDLRVLAIRGADVVLDATMRVQATAAEWASRSDMPVIAHDAGARALVTGATGAIGSAVALDLARRGWSLLLQDRADDARRAALRSTLERFQADVRFVGADLATPAGRTTLAEAVSGCDDLGAVVHCASPGVDATLETLVDVNYRALQQVAEAAVPALLARQQGAILLVGSTAMTRHVAGMADYAAAKTMAATIVNGIEARFAPFGVRGLTLMPGFVATPFSAPLRHDAAALSPEEVADAVASMIERPPLLNTLVLEAGRRVEGQFGFRSAATAPRPRGAEDDAAVAVAATSAPATDASAPSRVAAIVARELGLPARFDMADAELGATPGWDSLKQIDIVLALESALGVSFSSAELSAMTSVAELEAVCRRRAGAQ